MVVSSYRGVVERRGREPAVADHGSSRLDDAAQSEQIEREGTLLVAGANLHFVARPRVRRGQYFLLTPGRDDNTAVRVENHDVAGADLGAAHADGDIELPRGSRVDGLRFPNQIA
jgi:hypothetical protein